MLVLTILNSPDESSPPGSKIEIEKISCILGRAADCDIQLTGNGISRRHIEVSYDGEGWWVKDLGSKHGTLLNYSAIEDEEPLEEGDRLGLGEYLMQVFAVLDLEDEMDSMDTAIGGGSVDDVARKAVRVQRFPLARDAKVDQVRPKSADQVDSNHDDPDDLASGNGQTEELEIDEQLQILIDLWPDLPQVVKAGILAMVSATQDT